MLAMPDFKAFLDTVAGSGHLVLPLAALAAYEYSARCALKTYIAAQQLPVNDAEQSLAARADPASNAKKDWTKKLGFLAAALLLSAEAACIYYKKDYIVDAAFQGVVAAVLVASNFTFIARLLGFDHIVYRRPDGNGAISCTSHTPDVWSKIGSCIVAAFAVSNSYLAITQPTNVLLRSMTTAALIFTFTSKCNAPRISIRKIAIFFLAYEAVVLQLLVGIVFATHADKRIADFIKNGPAATARPLIGGVGLAHAAAKSDVNDGLASLCRIFGVLVPAMYAAPIGLFIAVCLRFDWHQGVSSLASRPSAEPSEKSLNPVSAQRSQHAGGLAFQTIPMESRSSRLHFTPSVRSLSWFSNERTTVAFAGVLVPSGVGSSKADSTSTVLPHNRRTYFNMCMSLTAFTYLFVAPALHKAFKAYVLPITAPRLAQPLEDQLFSLISLFITLPLLVAGVCLLAKMRGEFSHMWKYEETIWKRAPAQARASTPEFTDADLEVAATSTSSRPRQPSLPCKGLRSLPSIPEKELLLFSLADEEEDALSL